MSEQIKQLEFNKHQMNLQNKVLDHASSMDQINAKPKSGGK